MRPFVFLIFAIFSGCLPLADDQGVLSSSVKPTKVVRAFEGSKDQVWNVAVSVMESYLLEMASRENGVLGTAWLEASGNYYSGGLEGVSPLPDESYGTHRSSLRLKIIAVDGDTTEVVVLKKLQKFNVLRGVFEPVASNSAEEKIILDAIESRLSAQRGEEGS